MACYSQCSSRTYCSCNIYCLCQSQSITCAVKTGAHPYTFAAVILGEYIYASQITALRNAVNSEEALRDYIITSSGSWPNTETATANKPPRKTVWSPTNIIPGDEIFAFEFNDVKTALDELMTTATAVIDLNNQTWSSEEVAIGDIITAVQYNSLRDIIQNIAGYCVCNAKSNCGCNQRCSSNCSCQSNCLCNCASVCSCYGQCSCNGYSYYYWG